MQTLKVVWVEDVVPSSHHQDAIKISNAIESVFSGGWQVQVDSYEPKSTKWIEEAGHVVRLKPQVILSDCYMPDDEEDGVKFLHALCCNWGYEGFIYLWSTSPQDRINELMQKFSPLFDHAGSGGFSIRAAPASSTSTFLINLAESIHHAFIEYGEFRIKSPEERCFNCYDIALDLLCSLTPICFYPNAQIRQQILESLATRIGVSTTHTDYPQSFTRRLLDIYPGNKMEINRLLMPVQNAAVKLRDGSIENTIENIQNLHKALLAVCTKYND